MNRIAELFGIKYPIIQGGMVWVSGAKLAAAVSNAGGLGLIGAGSMKPDLLEAHIKKARTLTSKPFGVNIPIFSKYAEKQVEVALDNNVDIFFMSAGSPKKFTNYLKEKGKTVVHVTSTPQLAYKCEQAGVDAVVVEGFEAGGHNGRDELTSFVLIPQAVDLVNIPVIAAGGIADGRGIAAAVMLGAEGVQIGTLFAASKESSAHINYKNAILNASSCDTVLALKDIIPVRLIKNKLTEEISILEKKCAKKEEILKLLGNNPAKEAIFEGKLDMGEIEVGQCCAMVKKIEDVNNIIEKLIKEFNFIIKNCKNF
ncbi:MAG: nitronate monooxygenase [Chlorobi bacterium]|nr:nitronate monooxygenase [Chlorobiota bacterium]